MKMWSFIVAAGICGCAKPDSGRVRNEERRISVVLLNLLTEEKNFDKQVVNWNKWILGKVENGGDVQQLIMLVGRKRYDNWLSAGEMLDPLGNSYVVGVARNGEKLMVSVDSSGPDGIPKTDDDIKYNVNFDVGR